MLTNPIYSLLTQHIPSVSHHKSKLSVKTIVKDILAKFVSNEEQALVCLLTLFYSHYYKDLNDQPKSYEEENLVLNIKALDFIQSTLNSNVVADIQSLMSTSELAEFAALKCFLDRFAYLIKTLVIYNDG